MQSIDYLEGYKEGLLTSKRLITETAINDVIEFTEELIVREKQKIYEYFGVSNDKNQN